MIKVTRKQITSSFFIFVVLCGIIIYYLNMFSEYENNIGLIISFMTIGGICIVNIISDNYTFSLNKIFWYFNFVFLFIAPLFQHLSNYYPWNYFISDELKMKTNFIIIIAFVIYDLVMILKKKRNIKFENYKIKNTEVNIQMVLSVIALLLLTVIMGINGLFLRDNNAVIQIGENGLVDIIIKIIRSIPVFTIALYIVYCKNKGKRIFNIKMIILLLMVLYTNFPTSLSRYWMGAIYLGIFILIYGEKIKGRQFDILLILVLMFLFPLFQIFKNETIITIFKSDILKTWTSTYNNVDYDAYSMLARIIKYVETNGIVYGKQVLGTIFFLVPRSIWGAKPIPTGVYVATMQRANFVNLSAPYIGEGYINFGIFGVILFMGILASIIKQLDYNYFKYREKKGVSIIELIYPFTVGYIIFLMRGSMHPAIVFLFLFLVYFLVVFQLKKIKGEKKGEEDIISNK